MFAEKTVASTGNGDAMFEGVKPCQLLEFMGKFHTPFLEEADIGFAIGQQFLLKVELVMFCHTGSMPFLKFCFSGRAHAFRIVVVTGKNRSYVVFMFFHIKKMGEKPFFSSHKPKALGKLESAIRKKDKLSRNLRPANDRDKILVPSASWSSLRYLA